MNEIGKLERTVRRTVRTHHLLDGVTNVVLGLSGGPDSMCLLDVLMTYREQHPDKPLRIHPVHVNHMIRGEEADRDQRFVEEYCRKLGLDCRVTVFDCPREAAEQGISEEAAGRRRRYAAFREEAERIRSAGADTEKIVIATAHQADDRTETVLLRILRGTGPDGLAAVAASRPDRSGFRIIRPLIDVSKEEILAYCREKGIPFRTDRTNSDPSYTRNRVRLELLPVLRKFNPEVDTALRRLSEAAKTDRDYFEEETERAYAEVRIREDDSGRAREWELSRDTECADREYPSSGASESSAEKENQSGILLDRQGLMKLHPAVRVRLLRRAAADAGLPEDLSFSHFNGMEELLRSDSPSAAMDLPEGFRARREYETLRIFRPGKKIVSIEDISKKDISGVASSIEESGSGAEICNKKEERIDAGLDDGNHEMEAAASISLLSIEDFRKLEPSLDRGRYAAFDWAKVRAEGAPRVRLRTRLPGDRIRIGSGRKKLQDLFVDEKIPKSQRDQVPVFAAGHSVLFVPSDPASGRRARYAAGIAVTDSTETVLLLQYKPEERQ